MRTDSVLIYWSARSADQSGNSCIQQSTNYRTCMIRQCLRCWRSMLRSELPSVVSSVFHFGLTPIVWRRNEKLGCSKDDIDGRDRLMIGGTGLRMFVSCMICIPGSKTCSGKIKSRKVTAIQRNYGVRCPPYYVVIRISLEEHMQIMSLLRTFKVRSRRKLMRFEVQLHRHHIRTLLVLVV